MLNFCKTKVNLGLEVAAKRPDGYHELKSFFYPVPYGDILELEKSDEDGLTVFGISVTAKREDNLVWKGWMYMKAQFELPALHWYLHKVVPPGTGIGAGSADLAEMLIMTNAYFNLNLSLSELEEVALKFGSDTGFFIRQKPAFVTGRGDKIAERPNFLEGRYLVLVKPKGLHMSTAEAFANIKPAKENHDFSDPWNYKVLHNDFQEAFENKFPVAKSITKELSEQGAHFTSLSGSGSVYYGIFNSAPKSDINVSGADVIWSGVL